MDRSELLVKCGFIKSKRKKFYQYNEKKELWEPTKGYTLNPADAAEEITEIGYTDIPMYFGKTGFPKTKKTYHLLWENYDLSMEEPYFWILRECQNDFPLIEKLEDSFTAAENSAFFGITQIRLGGQQEKVSQFLATTGKMIKELFQMVRELRIIDERMGYYLEADNQLRKPLKERSKSADITLKGFFVDLVQGGGKNPASIFGMARELEFITLPDLFFDALPFKEMTELDAHIESLRKDFNESVLRVLQRHLRQFMEWKKRTYSEHVSRRRFMLSYLLQHFEIIKMYIQWVKPYLRHVSRLTMNAQNVTSPELISAFEGSMLDIEFFAYQKKKVGEKGLNGGALFTFNYRTRPDMKFVQEGYQRGPVHVGKFEVHIRIYNWSDEQLKSYKKLKELENFALIGDVSESVRKAMESLGDELDYYLAEARGDKDKLRNLEGQESTNKTFMQKYFGDFYNSNRPKQDKRPKRKSVKKVKDEDYKIQETYGKLLKTSKRMVWKTYKNFKKAHKLTQF